MPHEVARSGTRVAPFPVPQADPADQRNYTERYAYDAVGNIVQLVHAATTGWTRNLAYDDYDNRLQRTWFGTAVQAAVTYARDTHSSAPDPRPSHRETCIRPG